ncbi:hypothetical protein RJ639_014815 [Escallonia herrerae]|uniref:Homeobox domain-containing protein n=1 Tax=Escallonia herrerae TaxID=1293975 RepID=A0AA89AMY0_9ASTE|nr:hypothetical protein RJ639_014815 [Escallonia herrerae]
MESQQQQNQPNEDGGGGGKGNSSSYLCRQSSTRWTPTTDQIRILKDLYYNNGVRSPTAEQIQRISARLRQYGKIEGKNVFYWFQNHKARERQKKRFTTTNISTDQYHIPPMAAGVHRAASHHVLSNGGGGGCNYRRAEEYPIYSNKYHPNITPTTTVKPVGLLGILIRVDCAGGLPSSSSAKVVGVGQLGNCGYGSVAMEKSFRECSISPEENVGETVGQNLAWVGVDSHSSLPYYPFLDKRSLNGGDQTQEEEEEEDEQEEELVQQHAASREIETLPLFPMHGEDHHYSANGFCENTQDRSFYYTDHWFGINNGSNHVDSGITAGSARASLELSLNSYPDRSTDY